MQHQPSVGTGAWPPDFFVTKQLMCNTVIGHLFVAEWQFRLWPLCDSICYSYCIWWQPWFVCIQPESNAQSPSPLFENWKNGAFSTSKEAWWRHSQEQRWFWCSLSLPVARDEGSSHDRMLFMHQLVSCLLWGSARWCSRHIWIWMAMSQLYKNWLTLY